MSRHEGVIWFYACKASVGYLLILGFNSPCKKSEKKKIQRISAKAFLSEIHHQLTRALPTPRSLIWHFARDQPLLQLNPYQYHYTGHSPALHSKLINLALLS
jgi:hypothetical protein